MKEMNYRHGLIVSSIILILVSIAYSKLYCIGFSNPDDDWMLFYNPLVKDASLSCSYFKVLFLSKNGAQYSPINTLYYALIFKINEFDPYYYHIFSFIFHVANGFIIYKISYRLLNDFQVDQTNSISLITTLLWLVSPVNVESVVWVSASKVVLFTFFSLLSFWEYLAYIKNGNKVRLILCMLYFIMAFLCKEQAVLLPIILFLYIMSLRKFRGENINWRDKLFLLFLFIVMFFLSVTAINISGQGFSTMSKYPFIQRLLLSFYCLYFYISSTLIPIDLHFHYPFPMKVGEIIPTLYYIFPILFIVIMYNVYHVLRSKRMNWFYFFCASAYIVNIGVCLQIVPLNRNAITADRYTYLPSFFFYLLIFTAILQWLRSLRTRTNYYLVLCLFTIYLIYFISYSNILVLNWNKISIK